VRLRDSNTRDNKLFRKWTPGPMRAAARESGIHTEIIVVYKAEFEAQTL